MKLLAFLYVNAWNDESGEDIVTTSYVTPTQRVSGILAAGNTSETYCMCENWARAKEIPNHYRL